MLEGALTGLATLLAFVGGAALVARLIRSGLGFALRAAEVSAARGMADLSTRRGDLTGMMERRRTERVARRARRNSILLGSLWMGWLVVPLFVGVAPEAYAIASVLWLLPRQPLRPSREPTPAE